MTTTNRPIRRALVSVFHKEGIEVLAEAFIKAGTEVVSTGSTAKRLAELGVKVTEVSEVTGFPECLDGRVKTLDPHIHAGILADMTNPDHASQLEKFGIKPFDLVVVNLYPFADTVRSGADEAATIEKIDIGGPSMVRGAAKNSATVAIITDPNDYALVASRIENGEGFSLDERRWLAGKAFAHTAAYDATINEWTAKHWPKPASIEQPVSEGETEVNEAKFPATFTRTWDCAHVLRYGENPHQQASLYLDPLNQNGFAHAEQLGGKPMSYNNYVDADAAWRAVWDFAPQIAVAVVKHNNPCGLAIGATVAEAHKKAHACDPMSAYGGVIAANSKVTMEMAENVRPIFTEVIVAPDYDADALEVLKQKKNRIILVRKECKTCPMQFRSLLNGVLMQEKDLSIQGEADLEPMTEKKPTAPEVEDLLFANKIVKNSKSNAITLVKNKQLCASGIGQTSRVDSLKQAIEKAVSFNFDLNGAVMASDAFFPFADCVEIADKAGITAVIQPGGSINDKLSVDYCNEHGLAMVKTGIRHFKH